MRVLSLFLMLWAVMVPVQAAKTEGVSSSPTQPFAFSAVRPSHSKALGDIETSLDRPEFDLDRAFDGASPNASIDLYSGALVVQAQDLVLPGPYGVDLEINRDFNGKVYVPRSDMQRVRRPDSWVGVGWSLNWGVLTQSQNMVVFQLSGYPIQRMYLATDGTGTDPAGNGTHDYRFRSPLSGDLIQPYMSKDFWRAWTEPGQSEGDPIWYVQDTTGKLFQIEKVDHVIGSYATTRIWHPKSPRTDIRFTYTSSFIRIRQRSAPESNTEVMVSLAQETLRSIQVGHRTLRYNVSRCGGNPQDPEERNCLVSFTNGENETTRYDYGSQGGNYFAELDRITTPLGGVYTYDYGDETYYHFRSPTGQFHTRVVRSWRRGDQVWAYDYQHPQVHRFDEQHQFYVATSPKLLTTVTGPENTRKQFLFLTYSGDIVDDVPVTTWAHEAGRLDRSAQYHQEYWNLERITGAQYREAAGLNEQGLLPALYFTAGRNPEDGKHPHLFLPAQTRTGFVPGDQLPESGTDTRTPFILTETRTRFEERGETDLPKGSTLSWVVDPYARPQEVISAHYNTKAPNGKHVTRRVLSYATTEAQKTHNQVFLIEEDRLFHNGPDQSGGPVILSKDTDAYAAGTAATVRTHEYNDFGDQTSTTTLDQVTHLSHTVTTAPDYQHFQVVVREPYRDDIRVTSRAGLPRQIEFYQNGEWITLRRAEYDVFGNMLSWSNSLDQGSSFEYDDADRIRFEYSPLVDPTETSYVIGQGAVIRSQVGDGPWEEISYDVYGRKVDHRLSEIPSAQFGYRYDNLDRLIEVSHPNGGVETWEYDTIDRITQLTRERDGRTETQRWQYFSGTGVLHTDALNHTTFQEDDGARYPSVFVDQAGGRTEIETDAFGRVTRVAHGSAVRTRAYSGLGRILTEAHPETGLAVFVYNSIGDMITTRFFADPDTSEAAHKVHNFEYDLRGRIKRQVADSEMVEAPSVRWEYDTENLISMHNHLADVVYDYDAANRLEARHYTLRQAGRTLTTRYGYSDEGLLATTTYPSGSQVTYTFDDHRHRVGSTVSTAFGTDPLVEHMTYVPGLGSTPNPVPGTWTLGNGTQEVRFFGEYGRPYAQEIRRTAQGGQRLSRQQCQFDAVGRVTAHETFMGVEGVPGNATPDQTASYQYDSLSRIVRAEYRDSDAGSSWFDDFFYDPDNNLVAYGGSGQNTPMQYPVSADFNADGMINIGDLHGFQFGKPGEGEVTFAHDLDGDGIVTLLDAAQQGLNVAPFALPEEPIPNRLVGWSFTPEGNVERTPDGKRYHYNTWNQLVGFGENQHLAYGPESQRILEWKDGESTKKFTLFNEAGDPIAEYVLEGSTLTLTRETFYHGGKPVAADVYEATAEECSERVWFHSDYLGSPTAFTDDSGSVTGTQRFAAFGQKWASNMACVPTGRGFTGHQDLADTDLTWMKSRSYSNRYGRFLQADPVTITLERLADPGQLNLYTYVGNRPTLAVDPKGEWIWHVAGAAIGAGADLTAQLLVNGGDFDKVSWTSVTMGAVSGAMGGGALKGATKVTGSVLKAGFERFAGQLGHDVIEHAVNGSGSAAGSPAPCFPAGTLVLSEEGLVPIEQITVDDWVWSRHDQTGEEAWQPVDQVFRKEANGLHHLVVSSQNDRPVALTSTAEHPFWKEPGVWISAAELIPSDRIWSRSGWVTVEENRFVAGLVPVYNFEVRTAHTYFVGEQGLWAHNSCLGIRKGKKRGPKTDPNAPHNKKVREEGDKIESEGGQILNGGGRRKETNVRTPGGHKTKRRPDILYRDKDGTLRGRNVGRTKADGSPVKREKEALEDLNDKGKVPTDFVPYDKTKGE